MGNPLFSVVSDGVTHLVDALRCGQHYGQGQQQGFHQNPSRHSNTSFIHGFRRRIYYLRRRGYAMSFRYKKGGQPKPPSLYHS